MNENGIMFMWWLDKNKPADVEAAGKQAGGEAQGWPIWANGLMGRAMVGYYAGSQDKRVLRTLETAYSGSRIWAKQGFAPTNLWPAFETYTWTGNKEIKKALTDFFAANKIKKTAPGESVRLYESWYNRMPDESRPWYRQPDHGVHFNESTIPWAIGYLWTGDREYLDAPCRWYEIIERGDDGMQPHGVPVCDENSGPTGSLRGTETCNVAGYMWSQITLLRVGGQGLMADRVERAFFNAAPAVVSRDFKTHVYHQTPNRIAQNLPDGGPYNYRSTQGPLCCTASLNRFLPNYLVHHVDGDLRQRIGRHALRSVQGLGAGGRSRAGGTGMPDRLSVQRFHRGRRQAGSRGDFPALVPHSRLVRQSRNHVERFRCRKRRPTPTGSCASNGSGSRATACIFAFP